MTKAGIDDAAKRWWEVNFGLANIVLAIAGLWVGIWQFNKGEINKTVQEYKSLREKDRIEFKRKLWLEQLEAYRATADEVGKMSAYANRGARFDSELQSFEAAYWGRMILVEDPAVAGAMEAFLEVAQDFRDGYKSADQLKQAASSLGKALQDSVNKDPVAIDLKKNESELQP